MNRNDLIVFEFLNPESGNEVLLEPAIVVELNDILKTCVSNWLAQEGGRPFDILLAGAERGSLKLGYLLRIMEHANTALDLSAKVGAAIFAVGVALGVFAPQGVTAPAPPVSDFFMKACGDQLDRLVRVAARSNVEEVSISIPGCGTAIITNSHSRDIELIGSSALAFPENWNGPYSGTIRNIAGPYRFNQGEGGKVIEVYAGEVSKHNGEWIPVVMAWGSKRPVSKVLGEQEISISGELSEIKGFKMQRISSDYTIDPALRKASAYLYVNSQTVSE